MRIVFLILITVIVYLFREITILKSYIATIPDQNIQTPHNYVTSNPRPRLLFWSSRVSPNGKYQATSFTGDYADRYHYYQVFITNLTNDKMNRIYSGDYRTSGWEWTDDNNIKIIYDCGTGCRAARVVSTSETLRISDNEEDTATEKNGWEVTFFKSF